MIKPVLTQFQRGSRMSSLWYVRCWTGPVQNATFASSAVHKATRIDGDGGNVSNSSSYLHSKLCVECPGLIALLLLSAFVISESLVRADGSANLVSVSTNTTPSVAVTNSINSISNTLILASNSLSISASQTVSTVSVSQSTNQSLDNDLPSMASVTLVIEKKAEGGPFSGQSGNGSFGFANLEAGFGQAYENDSMVLRGRNGTAWEETRYVFLKKIVKF